LPLFVFTQSIENGMGSIFEVVVYLVIFEIIRRLSIYIVNLLILLLLNLTVRVYVVFHHSTNTNYASPELLEEYNDIKKKHRENAIPYEIFSNLGKTCKTIFKTSIRRFKAQPKLFVEINAKFNFTGFPL
jgi:hypothetical protein